MIVGSHRRIESILWVALLASACGSSNKSDTGEACTLASDCGDSLSCSYGKCHATCVATPNCPQGQSCVMTSAGGVCQLPAEADCRATACPAGLLCAVDYRCRSACQTSAGCTDGQVCLGGVCADAGDLGIEGNLPVKNPGPSNPGQQCTVHSDCAALGSDYVCKDFRCLAPATSMTWACLDSAPETATGNVHMPMTLVNMLSQVPLAGAALSVCTKMDSTCMFPVMEYQSNSAGQIEIELPAGFDGYFQVKGDGIYPTLIFLPSTHMPTLVPLVSQSFYPTLVKGVGAPVAEDRSVILVTALDCLGKPAPGLSLASPQADGETASFVLAGGMPSLTSSTTDESGGGGFANIPAGPVLINATLAASNRPVVTAGVLTRPGYLSMVFLMPNGS